MATATQAARAGLASSTGDAFQVRDIVSLNGGIGPELIITEWNPQRPSNCWTGVKVRGQGKPYRFGPRHRPRKIGEAPKDHPALAAMQQRSEGQAGISGEYKAVVGLLVGAVLDGDLARAKVLAETVKSL